MPHKIVFVRHGQSVWNKENRFTGWTDVDLTERGVEEARTAADILAREGYTFDRAYTSVLKRAIRTLWTILDGMDLMWIPIERSWRLNERHYGDLQGFLKHEKAKEFGEEQVHVWRRSYDIPPPALAEDDERHPSHDPRYKDIQDLPATESLKLTLERVLPYWEKTILPAVLSGERVLVAAHGNSIRAIVKHLDGVSDEEITSLNIPYGVPLVYELDDEGKALNHYYLGDPEEIAAVQAEVAAQGTASYDPTSERKSA